MKSPGIMNISLDFELHWGCFERVKVMNDEARAYFRNTREVIPLMLDIFSKNEMHVTWAIVGMLYHKNRTAWENNLPSIIPTFENKEVSAYEWIQKNGFEGDEDPSHFAPELIRQIKNTPNQEIGTHTYAHYFCLEKGQSKEQFREDIRKAKELASAEGIQLQSLVFPRNQYNPEYLSVCHEFGIDVVRTNPDIWYWSYSNEAGGFLKRFFRAGDAYLKFQPAKMICLSDIRHDKSPIELPASRLYRPWRPHFAMENKLKMRRIINEMTKAAQIGAYYHIWWHPENFGNHPQQCINELHQIANHYQTLKQSYGFESLTMHETAERVKLLSINR